MTVPPSHPRARTAPPLNARQPLRWRAASALVGLALGPTRKLVAVLLVPFVTGFLTGWKAGRR